MHSWIRLNTNKHVVSDAPPGFLLEIPLNFWSMNEGGMAADGSETSSNAAAKSAHRGQSKCNLQNFEAVKMIRELISTRPDVGFLRTDDEFIIRFLRARKYNIEASFNLLARYFEYRQRNKNLFRKFNAAEPGIQAALLDGFPGVLPQRDDHGRKVLVLFTANWDHIRYSLLSIYRAILLTLEKLIQDEETQLFGFVMVVDWSGFTFRQSSNMNPKLLKLIVEGLQDCFPGRFAGIHFISQPWYVEAILTLIKPFLKDKTKEKLFIHGNNLTTLHAHISRDILPAELGGSRPPYNIEQWQKQLTNDTDLFAFSDRHIYWPEHSVEKPTVTFRSAPRSETFPSAYSKTNGTPSVTELDENFFLNE